MWSNGAIRKVGPEEARAFARLSGDFNPVHLSAVEARRTIFGRPIVHGIYLVFAVLDQVMADRTVPAHLRRLRATFHRSISIGADFSIRLDRKADEEFTATILSETAEKAATIRLSLTDSAEEPQALPEGDWPEVEPLLFDPAASARSGSVPLRLDDLLLRSLFPAAALLPRPHLAALLASTQVVGMRCPGLHSIFSALDLTFSDSRDAIRLDYAVKSLHPDFGMVALELVGPSVTGSAEAFLRPRPVAQPRLAALQGAAPARDFLGVHAMVLGGNRGIGEVAAKLLALRGAAVTITYHRGKADAGRVVAEAADFGLRINMLPMDVTDAASVDANAASLKMQDHIVYCATPPIQATAQGFSRPVFDRYCDFYVAGMTSVVLMARTERPLSVSAPSTVFLDEPQPGYGEYIASKAAAEALSRNMNATLSGLTIAMPRLDRVLTDQTNAIAGGRLADVVDAATTLVNALRPTNATAS